MRSPIRQGRESLDKIPFAIGQLRLEAAVAAVITVIRPR